MLTGGPRRWKRGGAGVSQDAEAVEGSDCGGRREQAGAGEPGVHLSGRGDSDADYGRFDAGRGSGAVRADGHADSSRVRPRRWSVLCGERGYLVNALAYRL